ncbi:YheC/YheD family protein [Natranaerofaba carboxydovora]|uniref:YheC/YheD family endospore coat-associated protein n=1 Tax=Natranaerofaba carboxydovora TaxID=2742683 RepID=UPI001F148551|nr:YheC/YheD family protein [Natranaerofaba carboxydovora]UMZ72749.1 Endospore coat-associated protein YheD [Natranaerofaba carboxydovora]
MKVKNKDSKNENPVLGIFVKPARLSVDNSTTDLDHILAGHANNFVCYLFSIDSIDWEHKKIKGLTFDLDSNEWCYRWFSFPDVIYDRGSGFSESEKEAVSKIRTKFRDKLKIKTINSRDYIGKWNTYKYLLSHDFVAKYLPVTIRYQNFNDVLIMLRSYKFIFIKSFYGKRGKEVMSIEKTGSSSSYKVATFSNGLLENEIGNIQELKKIVEEFMDNNSGGSFLVQQGIRLLNYKNRPFDIRILLIKDSQGKWQAINSYARIAAKENQTITNYSVGSECNFYSNIYPELLSQSNVNIPTPKDVSNTAVKIAYHIEKEFCSFGELGLDIAVDINGKLWFLEVNTKPDKDLVEGLDDCQGVHPQFQAIFDYARFLYHY